MKMDTQITQLRGITLKLSPPIERYHQRIVTSLGYVHNFLQTRVAYYV